MGRFREPLANRHLQTPRPFVDYFKALLVCLGAAIGYRLLIVPRLEPIAISIIETTADETESLRPNLTGVFADDTWQVQSSMVLQAPWGVLLFKEWQEESPGRWRVAPVSIVLRQDNETNTKGPIILDATEGAVVELTEPLNMLSGGTPTIKGGQLVGDVHIYSMPKTDPQEVVGEHAQPSDVPQTFDLRTRNVRIDNRQIRSAEAISLLVGDARILGRDLTIHLANGGTLPRNADSPLAVLDSLELIYLDELTVPLANGPLWEPIAAAPETSRTGPASLAVHCDGRVLFDFTTFKLRLAEGVAIDHQWSVDGVDRFACRELQLQLADPFAKPDMGDVDGKTQPWSMVKRIEASGTPIRASLSSINSRLVAGRLDIHVADGTVDMAGYQGPIDFQYMDYRFRVPTLKYQMNPNSPHELGTLVCDGRGIVDILDQAFAAQSVRWEKSLQIFQREEGNYLWVDGQVRGDMRDGGQVGTDDLLVLFHMPEEGQPQDEIRPEKLRARGNVIVDTADLAVNTDNLTVLFERVQDGTVVAETTPQQPKLNPATGPPMRFWIRTPGPDKSHSEGMGSMSVGALAGTRVHPVARPRPVLRGDTINAKLWLRGTEIVAQDLSAIDQVQLNHELITESGRLPLTYRGDSLRLVGGFGNEQVQIAGQPARIDLADGFFEGPLVVIDGRENRISIRDRGVFQMPAALMPQGDRPAVGAAKDAALMSTVRWIVPPRCEFVGELTFNGQLVEISPDVHISGRVVMGDDAEIWDIQATSPRLELALGQPVKITDPATAKQAAVDRVSLVGEKSPVFLVATKFAADGTPLGRHQLHNPRLDFFVQTGQLAGSGPGWYRSWVPSGQNSPMRSVAPLGSLLATHLSFNGGIEGDVHRQQIDFYRGVRVGMSSVSDWNAQIDAQSMLTLDVHQGTIDCDRLRLGNSIAPRPGVRMPLEIQALGGVAFRIRTERGFFDGTATRIAYDGGNELFVLQGNPQRAAVVRNLNPAGQEVFQWTLPELYLRSDTLELDARVQGATVSQLPSMSR